MKDYTWVVFVTTCSLSLMYEVDSVSEWREIGMGIVSLVGSCHRVLVKLYLGC